LVAATVRPGQVTQPLPPVTASAFPIEPEGTAPANGDGLIPNPQRPLRRLDSGPWLMHRDLLFRQRSTSADVNSWIASNENSITATTVVCLSGTFDDPIHVWSKSSAALLKIVPEPGSAATLDLGEVRSADTKRN
jgi:hypothetical protein